MTLDEEREDYNRLYDEACSIFSGLDLCKFSSKGCAAYTKDDNAYCCCRGNMCGPNPGPGKHCEYWKERVGCTTKSIACKLWTCSIAFDNIPQKRKAETVSHIEKIKNEALQKGYYVVRGNFDDYVKYIKNS
jgi:hypothetical protein